LLGFFEIRRNRPQENLLRRAKKSHDEPVERNIESVLLGGIPLRWKERALGAFLESAYVPTSSPARKLISQQVN
jgi:hypothetical protein